MFVVQPFGALSKFIYLSKELFFNKKEPFEVGGSEGLGFDSVKDLCLQQIYIVLQLV